MAAFMAREEELGLSDKLLRQRRAQLAAFYSWLPEGKMLSRALLLAWRRDMLARGYSENTVSSYIKTINRYLDYSGCSALCFKRGHSHDLSNMSFGYLTALEPTGERSRKDVLWLCRCKCGNECKVPATSLVSGNTLSCGCLKAEHIKAVNKFIDHTSLRMVMDGRVESDRSLSGYTGVVPKRGQWVAQIKYKGKNYHLGSYSKLEDAVKARLAAKQLVQEDAQKLMELYEQLHEHDAKPARESLNMVREAPEPDNGAGALRSNNKSGCTGVYKRRDKWLAKITYRKKTYLLGSFDALDAAVAARKAAEQQLREDPQRFLDNYSENFAVYGNK